jgi:hypothetical protein
MRRLAEAEISLEHHDDTDGAYSDIEISLPGRFRIIIEAKINLAVPTQRQLETLRSRLIRCAEPYKKLIVLLQWQGQRTKQDSTTAAHLDEEWWNWADVRELVEQAAKKDGSTFALQEFLSFLQKEYDMPLQFEAEVWVVPLGRQPVARGSSVTLADVPAKFGKYIFPTRFNPRRTLYIGFRYDGKLQSIHRILERVDGVQNYSEIIPQLDAPIGEPCTAFDLGDPLPLKDHPPSGPLRNTHVYCDLDLLLTSRNVQDAARRTRERRDTEI